MLNRIVIGTANWGRDYNGHNVSESEQGLIMEYMKEVGIEWLDVAEAYNTEELGDSEFKRIVKGGISCFHGSEGDIMMAHSMKWYDPAFHEGVSIYCITDIPIGIGIPGFVEMPYGIMNKHANDIFKIITPFVKVIARSIFCKGKALKYFSPQECIDFVLMNPRIDKVIIGVDSVDQLRENIAHLVKMEKFTHNEEVDTRKF